jgi:hypothetical protein
MKISNKYIAGFVDGEGHISVVRRIKSGRNGFNYAPVIMITNTNKKVLELIRENIGGRLIESISITSYTDRDKIFRITINKSELVVDVLNKIIPYLIIKKEQAILVRDFCKSRIKNNKKHKQNGAGTSSKYTKKELDIYSKIEKLMPRGHKI